MSTKDSRELTGLLTKLYGIQEDVGAKPATTAEEKVDKANNASMQGKGRAAKKSGARFLELKSSIVARLRKVHDLLEEDNQRNSGQMSVAGGANPNEVIKAKSMMREEIKQAADEWKEMEQLYKVEARKRRSKFTKEQLDIQQTLVTRLNAEIEKVREMQMQGYARRDTDAAAVQMNVQALASLNATNLDGGLGDAGPSEYDLEFYFSASFLAFYRTLCIRHTSAYSLEINIIIYHLPYTTNSYHPQTHYFPHTLPEAGGDESNWSGGQGPGVELTEGQSLQMQQIQNRDKEFDKELDEIGEGIADLGEIAAMQSEEVQRQNIMLTNVETKIDNAADHIQSVNTKMKETLDQVRGADKVCVDIMCILMMVGLGAVFWNLAKNN